MGGYTFDSSVAVMVFVIGLLVVSYFRPAARRWVLRITTAITVVMLGIHPYLALVWVPPEQQMGDVYRIIYVHVPQIQVGMLAMAINGVCSLAYLLKKSWVTDSLAEASAEVAVYMASVAVLLGSIWGKPTWGVYWDWDPRLTTATILIVTYMGYLALRSFVEDPEKRATWSGVMGIIAFVNVPITWQAVKIWASLHQKPSNPKTVDPQMVWVLHWSQVAFFCLMVVFVWHRYLLAKATREKEVALPEALPPPAAPRAV